MNLDEVLPKVSKNSYQNRREEGAHASSPPFARHALIRFASLVATGLQVAPASRFSRNILILDITASVMAVKSRGDIRGVE